MNIKTSPQSFESVKWFKNKEKIWNEEITEKRIKFVKSM